jgi:hypothetical protein
MASLQTLERRILALEARLAEVEGGYGDTLYKVHRDSVANKLGIHRILDHLQIDRVTEEDVDNALDQE